MRGTCTFTSTTKLARTRFSRYMIPRWAAEDKYGRSDAMIGSSPILEPSLISSVCPQVAPTYRLVPNSKEMDEDMK
jgi:hypothetical protein